MSIAITHTLANGPGNVVDAVQLNTNFHDVADPLNGTENMDILIKNNHAANPPLTVNETSDARIQEWQKNSTRIASINNDGQFDSEVVTGTPPIIVDSTTECPNLNAAMVGGIPGLDVAQLDTHKTAFSREWFISNPDTFPAGDTSQLPCFICPEGTEIQIRKLKVSFNAGSHNGGDSITFNLTLINAAGAVIGSAGTIQLNDTNNTVNVTYSINIGPSTLSEGDKLYMSISAKSATLGERAVTITVHGKQKLTT